MSIRRELFVAEALNLITLLLADDLRTTDSNGRDQAVTSAHIQRVIKLSADRSVLLSVKV